MLRHRDNFLSAYLSHFIRNIFASTKQFTLAINVGPLTVTKGPVPIGPAIDSASILLRRLPRSYSANGRICELCIGKGVEKTRGMGCTLSTFACRN